MKKVMSLTLLLCTAILAGQAFAVPVEVPTVPEPSTLLLIGAGAGVAGLALLRNKFKK